MLCLRLPFAVAFQDRIELNKNVDLVQRAPRVGEAEDARQPEIIQEAFEIFLYLKTCGEQTCAGFPMFSAESDQQR